MIVFDLKCAASGHVFEAWFANSSAYEDQRARRLLMCPICGDTDISKALMAPSIPAKGNTTETRQIARSEAPEAAEMKALLGKLAKIQSKALENSTWVGRDFDRQARAMDAGEVPHGTIHGEVTKAEAQALVEDGVKVMPLLLPVVPPEQQN